MAGTEFVCTSFDSCVDVDTNWKVNAGSIVSWDDLYRSHSEVKLHAVEAKVQRPPEGSICKSDLLWELPETQRVRRVQGNQKKDVVVVEQCFIPTTRIQDFIRGMENSNGGVPCRYVKIRTKPTKGCNTFSATETTPKEVTRYHCQYGPEDHTGNVKRVTSLLLPKQRPKVVVSGAAKSRGPRKKRDPPVEGALQTDKGKKGKGRKKSDPKDVAEVVLGKPKRTRKGKQPSQSIPKEVAEVGVGKPKRTLKGKQPSQSSPKEVVEVGVVKPKRTRKVKQPSQATAVAKSGITVEDGMLPADPHTSQRNAVLAEGHSVECSVMLPDQERTLRNTTEKEAPNSTASCKCCLQEVQHQLPWAPALPPLVCSTADLNESCKPFPRVDIDLNLPPEDFQPEHLPLPSSDAKALHFAFSPRKPPQNRKSVLSKTSQPSGREARTLAANVVHLDLNAAPSDCENDTISTVTQDASENGLGAVSSAPQTNSDVVGNTANEQHTAEPQSPETKKNSAAADISTDEKNAAHSCYVATEDNSTVVRNTTDGQNTAPLRPSANGRNRTSTNDLPKKSRDSLKQWGGSLKRGCLASFSVKTLYLLPHVTEISIFQGEHVNAAEVQCHGLQQVGDRSAFSWHLSPEIKDFVVKLLRDGHSVPQVMTKHIQVVKECLMNGKDISRDMFLHERDVRNLATKVARETYMLDTHDAKSVQLWVQANSDSVFYYQETGVLTQGELTSSNLPFTVGIQTPWQREVMLQFGHESGVSIDATFGTNENKFPLYTVMVFDEWHNGIPVAFILTSRSAQENLTPWMKALDTTLKRERSEWKPNAFIVDCAQGEINSLRIVWPLTAIFLCLWHVHRAWQKQACIKIQDSIVRAQILRGLCSIMYDRTGPSGDAATEWAVQKLQQLQNSYPAAVEFWDYVRDQWLPKVHMWVVGYRNLPYAGQDTNAAVESYHSYMKSVLKAERSRMTGRRVDWCIHVLTGDVLTHYWYQRVRKQFGFVDNREERNTVVSALILARDIPDSDVTLPEFEGGPAYVTSTLHRHLRYVVQNLHELWASCNCVHSQRGNTCKHKVKVLRLLHPQLAEGIVARYCGALKGTGAAGTSQFLTPRKSAAAECMRTPHSVGISSPSGPRTEGELTRKKVDIHTILTMQAQALLDLVAGNYTMMEHLHAEFHRAYGKMKILADEIESGIIHPSKSIPVFHPVQDGLGMRLGRLKDMLERKGKPAASRRLRLGGESPA